MFQRSPFFPRKEPWRNLYPPELSPRERYELDLFYEQNPSTLAWTPKKQLVNSGSATCPECNDFTQKVRKNEHFLSIHKSVNRVIPSSFSE